MSLNFFSQSKKPSWHLWQFPHHLPSTYHQDINFNVKTSSFLLAFPRLLLLSRDPYFIIIRLGSLLISHLPVSPHFSIFTIEIDISQFCDYEILLFSHSVLSASLWPHGLHHMMLPVLHHLPEFSQTRVRWVDDAIQPSHPLSPPSPPAFSLSQHQGLFQWVSSLHQVDKILELQHQSFQWVFRVDFL